MTFKTFEDLPVWQGARQLCTTVFGLTSRQPFSRDFDLVRQIRRSSGSIIDNIAEGFERQGNAELINFLIIAKGSAGELRSQLYRALDNGYITPEEFDTTFKEADLVGKSLSNFIQYLKTSPVKGFRYMKK